MKKIILNLFFLLTILSKAFAQGESGTAIIDAVFDSRGQKHFLSDIRIPKTIGSGGTISSISNTCAAGKFTLYFEAGSVFDVNPSMQTVLCQVYSDVSNLITSSIAPGGVRLHCRSYSGANGPVGFAGSYYCYPLAPINPNQGIVDGQVYKALISGTDPYINMPLSFANANEFYHGVVEAAIPTNTNFSISYNMTTTAIASNEIDFYSIMLHEAMHTLGVLSLIQYSVGASAFNSTLAISLNAVNRNYFSRYDQFLFSNTGAPLLVPSNSLCPNSGLTFVPSSSAIAVQQADWTGGNPQNITTCTNAAKYISPTTTISLYTPDYFESSSSLSHFEDICSGTYAGTCTPVNPPNYNDLIYVMSNKVEAGPCYVKRHITDQEQKVLCDLGYTVAGSYGSGAVAGSTVNFSGGGCTPSLTIYGKNDGITNYVYTYSTTTNSIVTTFSTLLANDTPTSGLTVSCMEMISSNAILNVAGTSFTVQAAAGSGFYLLKYYPKDISTGKLGNVTYVSFYFIPSGCISCNIINNGGFESAQLSGTINLCGSLDSQRRLDCWDTYQSQLVASELWSTNCATLSNQPFFLSTSTATFTPAVYPLATPNTNNQAVRLLYGGNITAPPALKNYLTSPLTNGNSYQVSFWINNVVQVPTGTLASINPSANPVVITVASNSIYPFVPTSNFPGGLNIIKQSTVNASAYWTQVTYSFTYSQAAPATAIIIGIDAAQQVTPTFTGSSAWKYSVFIDEFSINPITAPKLAIPVTSLCTTQSFTHLMQYVNQPTLGVISGPGVTQNGSQYDFNITGTLSPGVYPIAFTYTTTSGCLNTVYHGIKLENCCSNSTVATITATSVSLATLTNMALIKLHNTAGMPRTSYVICNTLFDGYEGFVFSGLNQNLYWRGNSMQNLRSGMTLTSSAIISTQGTVNAPSDNKWLTPPNWAGTDYGTFVDASAFASNSKFYINPSNTISNTITTPPNNFGGSSQLYSSPGNVIPTGGAYLCGGSYAQRSTNTLSDTIYSFEKYEYAIQPLSDTIPYSEQYNYIGKLYNYGNLFYNDSIRESDTTLLNFYNRESGTSIEKFTQIESNLKTNNTSAASMILASLDQNKFNEAKSNQNKFYMLYLKYTQSSENARFESKDLVELENLASLCAGINGPCVYQARALYQLITGRNFNKAENCSSVSQKTGPIKKIKAPEKNWQVNVCPNPNFGNFTIRSSYEEEILDISIHDISGKLLCLEQKRLENFNCVLELNLVSGMYFITIKNQKNESSTKKMVVTK